MSLKAVAATRNRHKVSEFKRILRGTGLQVLSLDDFPPLPEVAETGRTLQANALKKALAVSRALGQAALADDSGLFVPALAGRPGVRSARYAGLQCDYLANNAKLLKALRGRTGRERRAYFATVIVYVRPGRQPLSKLGKVWGRIAEAPRGASGFGYDPVFIPDGKTRTFAEMTPAQKNRISHRAIALRKMAAALRVKSLEKKAKNR